MARSSCSSRSQDRTNKRKPILLSEMKLESTCITQGLPLSLNFCNFAPKIDPLTKKRQSKFVKERHKSKRRRCQQYWHSSWTIWKHVTEENVLNRHLVRSYLQIEKK